MHKEFRVLLTTALMIAGVAAAQEPVAPSTPSDPAAASKQKPYFVSPDTMLLRCSSPEFLKCMKWGASECMSIITNAVAAGNAKVEAEAASKSEVETSGDFFKGYAAGVVVGKIHAASKGKLLTCVNSRKV